MTLKIAPRHRLADALVVAEDVRALYEPMMPDLLKFYHADGKHLPDPELMIAIDKHFSHRMVTEICETLGFFEGACVFVATVLLRQHDARTATGGSLSHDH